MIQTAIIPPAGSRWMAEFARSSYHLLLSDRFSDPEYVSFYADRARRGDTLVLDNSAHETSIGSSSIALLECIDRLPKVDEVVLTDRLFFGEDTLRLSTSTMESLVLAQQRGDASDSLRFVGVPQGRTLDEWLRCLGGLVDLGVHTIGISKDYEVFDGGLASLVRWAQRFGLAGRVANIHLLGWGRDLRQLALIASDPSIRSHRIPVRGVDSMKPIVYGLNEIALESYREKILRGSEGCPQYPGRGSAVTDKNYAYTRNQVHTILDNIRFFQDFASGESV